MMKIFAQHEGGEPVYLCEVGSFEEANAVIAILDQRFADWTTTADPSTAPPEDPRVLQMEGTGIYAEASDGMVWVEVEPGIWEKSYAD